MCDTFIDIPRDSSKSIIFGKNSDREPNEAHQIVYIPRQKRETTLTQATYIEVEHALETYEVILSKPFQMFGAEMGCNEFGVVIGNEAVFTKEKFPRKNSGLTGMDMLRLSLETQVTAKDALKHIIYLLDKNGQDACGGYTDSNFYYHNAFLIADRNEAFHLDTAGYHWAYKKINSYTAISNGLSITDDYDVISEITKDLVNKANEKGEKFNFAKHFSQFWMPKLAACEYRTRLSVNGRNKTDNFGLKEAFNILRQHKEEPFQPDKATTKSMCMHATGLTNPSSTTGSMVVEIPKEGKPVVWLTGTSSPCISLFKPFFFDSDVLLEKNFKKPFSVADDSYWWKWEEFFRNTLSAYDQVRAKINPVQEKLESEWIERVNNGDLTVSKDALNQSLAVLDNLSKEEYNHKRLNLFYKIYRNKINRQAGIQ